jgi:hypothetical protein
MLLQNQKLAVTQAWLDRCNAAAEMRGTSLYCNMQCRGYFTRPASLIWPFAAGVVLMHFNRIAPQAIKATSLALSVARLAAKAAPLARKWIR